MSLKCTVFFKIHVIYLSLFCLRPLTLNFGIALPLATPTRLVLDLCLQRLFQYTFLRESKKLIWKKASGDSRSRNHRKRNIALILRNNTSCGRPSCRTYECISLNCVKLVIYFFFILLVCGSIFIFLAFIFLCCEIISVYVYHGLQFQMHRYMHELFDYTKRQMVVFFSLKKLKIFSRSTKIRRLYFRLNLKKLVSSTKFLSILSPL